ncbi:MAG: hypothetical protein MMC33_009291 [Icmadophila ericetorum]|nr:hypothetical protein [Icmadophila ericetorum]
MFTNTLLAWAIVLAVTIPSTFAISTIQAVGAKFFTEDGNQFYIKGVAYQLTSLDPLINATQCQLDATLMQELGANTIRVYHIDATQDHDGCMSAFSDAGIYAFIDLDTFTTQINQNDPMWNQTQLSAFETVLDTFQGYDNLAGVFVGNEILTMANGSDAAPYIKAAARDVKAYRDSKGYRKIPIGYSAADIAALRPYLQDYLACSTNSSDNIDFFSLNAYEWCGDSSYTVSGYSQLEANATNYPIPIFFSETGCNTVQPRTFEDQTAILGPDMDNTWSGAIIYEWIEEANNYGLVSYAPPLPTTATEGEGGFIRTGTPLPVSPDFDNLKAQWATLTPTGVALSAYSSSTAQITPPACPSSSADGWLVNGDPSLPTLGQAIGQGGTPVVTGGPTATGSASASASATKGSASGGKQIAGMSIGLAGVMLGFIVWL